MTQSNWLLQAEDAPTFSYHRRLLARLMRPTRPAPDRLTSFVPLVAQLRMQSSLGLLDLLLVVGVIARLAGGSVDLPGGVVVPLGLGGGVGGVL